jgi:ParB family chromosome partitioning protein
MSDSSNKPARRTGLGRGIEALIPSNASAAGEQQLVAIPGLRLIEVAPSQVRPNPRQPRAIFEEDALAELEHSVREFGVLQPIVVRPVAEGYELIMGERRLRAATRAQLKTIPALVRETRDDNMLRDALLENLHRADLNALEEAAAYRQLLDDFGITQDQLADRLGRSRPQISNTMRLLKLPERVQELLVSGQISAGHARALLALDEPQAMLQFAQRVVREGLSVRSLEELVTLTDASKSKRKGKIVAGGRSELTAEFVEKLEDKLSTRVSIRLGRANGKNGQLIIEFASYADLKRILAELGIK